MTERRKRVACVVTEYRPLSHADVIVGRLLEGYEMCWVPVHPHVEVAALYTDQVPANDISRAMAAMHDVPIYPTIRDALTLGGDSLAVDGVVLVGEHGDYPWNDKGQHLYPRRRFFEATVAVFRESGRVVPVVSDKHLAWNWADARWMYDTARAMGIPFMAGSSLPLTDRQPPVQVPLDAPVEHVLVAHHGPLESYGFHALEMAQCLAERRRGGETGVASVQALRGAALWRAWVSGDRWPRDLLAAALDKAGHAGEPVQDYFRARLAERAQRQGTALSAADAPPDPDDVAAYLVEYRDGTRVTALMLSSYVSGTGVAVQTAGHAEPLAFRSGGYQLEHFSKLVWHIGELLSTGAPTYPVERTLLTTGLIEAAMTSRYQGGARLETPHLDVRYAPPRFGWQPPEGYGSGRR